jgi:hypothetical protein
MNEINLVGISRLIRAQTVFRPGLVLIFHDPPCLFFSAIQEQVLF